MHCSGTERQYVSPSVLVREKGLIVCLMWIGNSTLEIYLIHGFVLNLLALPYKPVFASACGIGIVAVNFAVTMLLCFLLISLLRENVIFQRVFFGKKL